VLTETVAFYEKTAADILSPDHNHPVEPDTRDQEANHFPTRSRLHTFKQMLRFALAGGLNTLVDLLILNGLLWLFPTNSSSMLLAFNSLAYSIGAINSFLLNKYWTFGQKQRTTRAELARFTLVTMCGIAWSGAILWLASRVLRSFLFNATVWANLSKLVAIAGTALISYLGMRLWVFVSKKSEKQTVRNGTVSAPETTSDAWSLLPLSMKQEAITARGPQHPGVYENARASNHSLSVVLATPIEKSAFSTCLAREGAPLGPTRASSPAPSANSSPPPASGDARNKRKLNTGSFPNIIHFKKGRVSL
jgi:putative flippase GtrA